MTVKKILEKEKPSLVITSNLIGLSTLATYNAIKCSKIPHIHILHDYTLICIKGHLFRKRKPCLSPPIFCRLRYKIYSRLFKPDKVIGVSNFVLDKHREYGFFENSKNFVLHNCLEKIGNNIDKRLKSDRVNILYTGQLTELKGAHILIEAFKKIKNAKLRLNIIGDGKHRQYLEKISQGDKRIKFYGKISNEKTVLFYRKAAVCVVPSIGYDSFPTVILESFMAGTPVVASRIGGIPELIKSNYNGFLFEPGDVDSLKEILQNLIDNPTQLKRLSRNAFESAKKYNMSTYLKNLENIIAKEGKRYADT